jgi:hypothetical protein
MSRQLWMHQVMRRYMEDQLPVRHKSPFHTRIYIPSNSIEVDRDPMGPQAQARFLGSVVDRDDCAGRQGGSGFLVPCVQLSLLVVLS